MVEVHRDREERIMEILIIVRMTNMSKTCIYPPLFFQTCFIWCDVPLTSETPDYMSTKLDIEDGNNNS